jgi:Fe2+ or Zn2+ uptake regulation protein
MVELLQAAGYKLTRPRQRVLETLRSASSPLLAQEVALQAGTSVASTYRVLGLLVALGLVSETSEPVSSREPNVEGRSRRYAVCSAAGHHHHHVVCRSCYAAVDLTSEAIEQALRQVASELERAAGFRVDEHELTLRGECAECRRKRVC